METQKIKPLKKYVLIRALWILCGFAVTWSISIGFFIKYGSYRGIAAFALLSLLCTLITRFFLFFSNNNGWDPFTVFYMDNDGIIIKSLIRTKHKLSWEEIKCVMERAYDPYGKIFISTTKNETIPYCLGLFSSYNNRKIRLLLVRKSKLTYEEVHFAV